MPIHEVWHLVAIHAQLNGDQTCALFLSLRHMKLMAESGKVSSHVGVTAGLLAHQAAAAGCTGKPSQRVCGQRVLL